MPLCPWKWLLLQVAHAAEWGTCWAWQDKSAPRCYSWPWASSSVLANTFPSALLFNRSFLYLMCEKIFCRQREMAEKTGCSGGTTAAAKLKDTSNTLSTHSGKDKEVYSSLLVPCSPILNTANPEAKPLVHSTLPLPWGCSGKVQMRQAPRWEQLHGLRCARAQVPAWSHSAASSPSAWQPFSPAGSCTPPSCAPWHTP